MITQFQDGFITKTKLNELVDGINALDSKILTTTTVKTVGNGGDFETLNQAIDWCKVAITNQQNILINILSGHKPLSGIIFQDVDLSHVKIQSEDSIVYVDRSAYISHVPLGYVTPRKAFMVSINSKTPIIDTFFSIDEPIGGIGDAYLGGLLAENSICDIRKGFIYFDSYGLDCSGSIINANGSNLRSDRDLGTNYRSIKCRNGSNANICYSNIAGQGYAEVLNGSILKAYASNGDMQQYSQTPNTITANGIIFK